MSPPRLGKQRTYRGAYSDDDAFIKRQVTNVGRDNYYPSRRPNVYVTDDGKSPIPVNVDANRYDSIGTEGDGLSGGFSGPVSRSRNHPK